MVERRDNDTDLGGIALAIPPAAVRRERRLDVERDYEEWREAEAEQDISRSLDGAKAILGRAAFSAMRATVNKDDNEVQSRDRHKAEADDALLDELERLAVWNDELTVVGGVTMTNGEAQEARQNVIDNDDAYADWAVDQGLISGDEKDAFKAAIRRKKELEDKRGRGTMTDAEVREAADLDGSNVGHAIDAATAGAHSNRGWKHDASIQHSTANESLRKKDADRLSMSHELFQSAPEVGRAFNAAVQAPQPTAPENKPPLIAPAARVSASGLDL